MNKYLVTFLDDNNELLFRCMAEDFGHAEEQVVNAYEGFNIEVLRIEKE